MDKIELLVQRTSFFNKIRTLILSQVVVLAGLFVGLGLTHAKNESGLFILLGIGATLFAGITIGLITYGCAKAKALENRLGKLEPPKDEGSVFDGIRVILYGGVFLLIIFCAGAGFIYAKYKISDWFISFSLCAILCTSVTTWLVDHFCGKANAIAIRLETSHLGVKENRDT